MFWQSPQPGDAVRREVMLHTMEGIGAQDRFLRGVMDAKRLCGLQKGLDKIMGKALLQTVKYTEVVFGSRYPQGKSLLLADDENRCRSP